MGPPVQGGMGSLRLHFRFNSDHHHHVLVFVIDGIGRGAAAGRHSCRQSSRGRFSPSRNIRHQPITPPPPGWESRSRTFELCHPRRVTRRYRPRFSIITPGQRFGHISTHRPRVLRVQCVRFGEFQFLHASSRFVLLNMFWAVDLFGCCMF